MAVGAEVVPELDEFRGGSFGGVGNAEGLGHGLEAVEVEVVGGDPRGVVGGLGGDSDDEAEVSAVAEVPRAEVAGVVDHRWLASLP